MFPASKLERILHKPSAEWTAEDLARVADEEGLGLVSLMHVGGDGSVKALDFAPQTRAHLVRILRHGERADGSSLFQGLPSGASDILLRPRLETAFLDPFAAVPALAVLCGHFDRNGEPLPQSPHTIVRRAFERVEAELEAEFLALGEVEYFLGHPGTDAEPERPRDRGYHATSPVVVGEVLRRRAIRHLADIGIPVKYAHAEVGYIDGRKDKDRVWEQHEIELGLLPLPAAADAITLTRWVIQNLARAEGLACRFDPVVKQGHAGSGLHVHSLVRPRAASEKARPSASSQSARRSASLEAARRNTSLDAAGRNTSLDAAARNTPSPASTFFVDGQPGPAGRWLIGGLVRLAAALMAFGNRQAGSFVRLLQAKETPVAITWSAFNRKALIRIPLVAPGVDPDAAWPPTIEFRLPDGSAAPHLLLAGMAQALVLGRNLRDLDALVERTASRDEAIDVARMPQLPRDPHGVAAALGEARATLEAGGVFPPSVIDAELEALVR